ncbi:EamA family transporter [Candidatus Woesearchaeota archaeon]|nr:EamA family transporter [Candidatus Woesearchaeota archaeon]
MNKIKYALLFIIASIPISFIGYIVREAATTANMFTINFYRFLTAAIALAIILPFIDKKTFKPSKKNLKMYSIIGFLIALNLTMFNIANTIAPIANVYLLASISPAVVILLSTMYLKEKVTQAKLIALMLTLIGLTIMNPLQNSNMTGNILALLSGATFGVMFTLLKKEAITGAGANFWYFTFATIFSTPLLYFGSAGIISALPWILTLGIISTALSYIATTLILREETAGTTIILQTIIIPLGAVLIAYGAFGEIPTIKIMIGGIILITGGIALEVPKMM